MHVALGKFGQVWIVQAPTMQRTESGLVPSGHPKVLNRYMYQWLHLEILHN